eukprot:1149986-Prymnesium_polylepis.2
MAYKLLAPLVRAATGTSRSPRRSCWPSEGWRRRRGPFRYSNSTSRSAAGFVHCPLELFAPFLATPALPRTSAALQECVWVAFVDVYA